jgi:hypothetical protein
MALPPFSSGQIERIANFLEHLATHDQLTSMFQVGHANESKPKRILHHCLEIQRRDGSGDEIARIIEAILDPVRFVGKEHPPALEREHISTVLAFSNLSLSEDGKVRPKPDTNEDLSPFDAADHPRLQEMLDSLVKRVEDMEKRGHATAVTDHATGAVLYAPREFSEMNRDDRIRACYQHAGLLFLSGKPMTNLTFRQRLGLPDESYTIASKIISDTSKSGLIRPQAQTSTSKKDAKYFPFLA